ncbi:MAG: hypothetical protein JWL72_4668 [Ilumatobacteraceae bacterium]|nr:hypothetical protein [Ilumatobacteraceae bacterium]MCU1391330.1 hypothetical protein [Ilumatobacteraceae bacterium]
MDDKQILSDIEALVHEERELESKAIADSSPAHAARIREIEVALDRCWDLLRQRRARKSAGLDPDGAALRPANVVEGYQQ